MGHLFRTTFTIQPPTSTLDPNHAVSIVGWDDNKVTQAPQPGAWIVKNSWGAGWGLSGYFWISYYDKHCGKNIEMGADQHLKMLNLSSMIISIFTITTDGEQPKKIAMKDSMLLLPDQMNTLMAVSFFTAADSVDYTIKIYDTFQGGQLQNELHSQTGYQQYKGFHTVRSVNTILCYLKQEMIFTFI
ncbi:MAG: lectin like domain-containing protein [Ignavibacteriales bacterium]|nr:lectin like domain-containing protein [Ignavibacteriales bacterium]